MPSLAERIAEVLHGPGKVWEEVQWVAFKQRPTRDDLVEQFGPEIGKKITQAVVYPTSPGKLQGCGSQLMLSYLRKA